MNITHDIHLALMKIARETGEEEFESIHTLKEKYDINITSEETTQLINTPKEISIIHDEIIEDLKEIHRINLEDISESQWEQIKNSKFWKNAQIQVASELIATNILSNLL